MNDLRLTRKRRIEELIVLADRSEDFREIYVEGRTDRIVLSSLLRHVNLKIVVKEIETLHVPREIVEGCGLGDSNKNRLIGLASALEGRGLVNKVVCLADKDLDILIGKTETYEVLLYTEGTSLETYLYTASMLQKFLDLNLLGFPKSAEDVLTALGPILREAFVIRASAVKLGLYGDFPSKYKNDCRRSFESFCEFDRNNCTAKFSRAAYMESVFRRLPRKDWFDQISAEVQNMQHGNIPNQCCSHGHEFFSLLGWYLRSHDGYRHLNASTITFTLYGAFDQSLLQETPFHEAVNRLR